MELVQADLETPCPIAAAAEWRTVGPSLSKQTRGVSWHGPWARPRWACPAKRCEFEALEWIRIFENCLTRGLRAGT